MQHAIRHVCRTGYCNCTHGPGLVEVPSVIFVEACAMTEAKRTPEEGPLAPD
ncbi:MAG: hypothetical protein OSB10_04385 [Planctomycetota bacterium]|nr:hypothetical protein [Planctomycetota bacterium]